MAFLEIIKIVGYIKNNNIEGKLMKRKGFKNYINSTPKKIIDVAVDLFATNGFKGTSIREIAKISGMTITNIYYYFGSKEGLLLEILEQLTRQIVEKLRQVSESDCVVPPKISTTLSANFW